MAGAEEVVAPADPGGGTPGQTLPGGPVEPPAPPEPPQPPAPPGDQTPAPPPGDTQTSQEPPSGGANENPGSQGPTGDNNAGSDSWTVGTDRSSDGAAQQGAASPPTGTGAGTDSTSGALSGADSGPSGPSSNSKDSLAIPPGVDNFDSFTGMSSGGMSLLLDGSPTCGAVACGSGAAGNLVASVAASAKRLQERAALERDTSRVAGLEKAMPPSPPGGIPGRAFSMPGSAGGGGAAFVLISMVAILGAALALGNWTTSFRLPTATWRLSAYVPPIESPG